MAVNAEYRAERMQEREEESRVARVRWVKRWGEESGHYKAMDFGCCGGG